MKKLKIILLIIGVIIAIPLIAALFIKKQYAVEKEISIKKTRTEVFNFIRFLKNQEKYSKWEMMDTEMKKTYRGTDGEVGFISAWESLNDEVGKGEQEIIKIEPEKRIEYELRFFKPFEAIEKTYMITDSVDINTTIVKWGFSGKINYPMNLMLLFMDFEEMIGDDLAFGLNKLKTIMENKTDTLQ